MKQKLPGKTAKSHGLKRKLCGDTMQKKSWKCSELANNETAPAWLVTFLLGNGVQYAVISKKDMDG